MNARIMTKTVTVNKRDVDLEQSEYSEKGLAEAFGYNPDKEWKIYRTTGLRDGANLEHEDRVSEPVEVSDGDSFTVIPEYVNNG